jgi:hypothetical protein
MTAGRPSKAPLGKAFHASNNQASDPLPNNRSHAGATCGKSRADDITVDAATTAA